MENPSLDKKEMERRSNDRIRVYNFDDNDFKVSWDSMIWIIPNRVKDNGQGKGQAVLPRYVAENYIKHFTDYVLGNEKDLAIKRENEHLIAKGHKPMGIDSQERLQFETQYSLNRPEARRDILKKIWLGVEEEYGMQEAESMVEKPHDDRSLDERLLEELETPVKTEPTRVSELVQAHDEAPPMDLVAERKEKFLKEVSK